jgi:DNA-binding NarL/FixJ family response regulator
MDKIKIGIVEDDEDIRQLTKEVIEISGQVDCKYMFASAEALIEAIDTVDVDFILMDIGLPGMSGTECVRHCNARGKSLTFIMYTTHFDSKDVFEALRAGAKGYILKGGSPERLIQDIYDIAEGGSPMSPQISRLVAESFNENNKKNADLEKLSKQEWEVLKALDRGLNYKEIAAERFVSTHTVRAQIRSIYEKLHVSSKLDAVRMIK